MMKHLKEASEFFDQQYIDNLLDKINQSGITSLSDIERNQLTLFSEDDKEVISTIEKMGDITHKFNMKKVKVICIKDHYGEYSKETPALKKDNQYLAHTDDNGFINFFDNDNVSQLVMFGWKLNELKDIVIPITEDKHIKSFDNFIIKN